MNFMPACNDEGTLYGCRCGAGRIKYGDINISDARPGERVQLETSEGGRKGPREEEEQGEAGCGEYLRVVTHDCDGVIGRELTARRAASCAAAECISKA